MPVFPFIAGLVAGAAAVTVLRGERARDALTDSSQRLREVVDGAQTNVRAAAVAGLDRLRDVMAVPEVEAPKTATPASAKVAGKAPKKRRAAPAARKTRPTKAEG